jgi:hypothetical protein
VQQPDEELQAVVDALACVPATGSQHGHVGAGGGDDTVGVYVLRKQQFTRPHPTATPLAPPALAPPPPPREDPHWLRYVELGQARGPAVADAHAAAGAAADVREYMEAAEARARSQEFIRQQRERQDGSAAAGKKAAELDAASLGASMDGVHPPFHCDRTRLCFINGGHAVTADPGEVGRVFVYHQKGGTSADDFSRDVIALSFARRADQSRRDQVQATVDRACGQPLLLSRFGNLDQTTLRGYEVVCSFLVDIEASFDLVTGGGQSGGVPFGDVICGECIAGCKVNTLGHAEDDGSHLHGWHQVRYCGAVR